MQRWNHLPFRAASTAIAAAVTLAACTSTASTEPMQEAALAPEQPAEPTGAATTNESSTTTESAATTSAPSSTAVETTTTPSTTAPPSTTSTTTTTTTSTTTTTLPEPLDVFDPDCVVRSEGEASIEVIAASNAIADPVALWLENGQPDIVNSGDLIDVCPNNAINDVDGEPRPILDDAAIQVALSANIERQQAKLNELFAGYGIADLTVDGVSGALTGQRLCAARLALGMDTTIADMAPGTAEQTTLFASDTLPTPNSTAIESERWVLIDRTCQIMFIGTGTDTTFVFPTSTGSEGFETRDQDRSEAFRFNPALDNGGWHDSSEFPVGVDNPLNGNLYKPLYFDLGQAIHGANSVPPTPQSKGCARLRVDDQNTFVGWLGLDDATGETWRKEEMNVTVNVQGEFIPRS